MYWKLKALCGWDFLGRRSLSRRLPILSRKNTTCTRYLTTVCRTVSRMLPRQEVVYIWNATSSYETLAGKYKREVVTGSFTETHELFSSMYTANMRTFLLVAAAALCAWAVQVQAGEIGTSVALHEWRAWLLSYLVWPDDLPGGCSVFVSLRLNVFSKLPVPYSPSNAGRSPLYRMYNSQIVDHFYTTDYSEVATAQQSNYAYEGIACSLRDSQVSATQPLLCYWSQSANDHALLHPAQQWDIWKPEELPLQVRGSDWLLFSPARSLSGPPLSILSQAECGPFLHDWWKWDWHKWKWWICLWNCGLLCLMDEASFLYFGFNSWTVYYCKLNSFTLVL